MSNNDHHQRRRRWLRRVQLWKLIVGIGQIAYYIIRFWFWITDPK